MNRKKSVDVLNALIQINNDRIDGYIRAINDTEEPDLRLLFKEFLKTSRRLHDELIEEVENLDGDPIEDTTPSGRLIRILMDVKLALSDKDRAAVLNSCDYVEGWALNTYEKTLNEDAEFLTHDQKEMIQKQHDIIKSDHDTIKQLRCHVNVNYAGNALRS